MTQHWITLKNVGDDGKIVVELNDEEIISEYFVAGETQMYHSVNVTDEIEAIIQSAKQVERRNALAEGAEVRHDCLQSTQPLDVCPNCGGDADNGFDRSWPDPVPYCCKKCTREDLEGVSATTKFSVEPKYTREELVEIMCRANADLSPVGSDALVYLSMDDCATGTQSPNWHRDLHKMHTALSALEQAGALQVKRTDLKVV